MILFKPLVELFVSAEETFQGFANDVLVRRSSEESRIALKHRVRFLVEAGRNYLLFMLGFYLRDQGHLFVSSAVSDSKSLGCLSATLPATERGTLLDKLGGSDPRRRRRWAAAKPLKVGSLPPKIRFSPRSTPMSVAGHLFLSLLLLLAASGNLAANPHQKMLWDLSVSPMHRFAPPRNLPLVVPISLNT